MLPERKPHLHNNGKVMELQYITMLINILVLPLMAAVGATLKRISTKVDNTMSKQEIRQVVDDKLAPVQVEYHHVHMRLANIEKELLVLISELRHARKEDSKR